MLHQVPELGLNPETTTINGHASRLRSGASAALRLARFVAAPLTVGWHYREFTRANLRRELANRFQGSLLGWAWAIVGPLVTLAIYTATFLGAIRLPVASARDGAASYALSTFVGLIVFNLCAEVLYRAPLLLHERAAHIKTSIFPSEMLAWTAVLRALAYAGISVVVLLIFELGLTGAVPASVVLLPLIALPLVLFLLGLVWCLAALGAFTRDLTYLMVTIVPMLMFATPVFYRVSDLPDGLQTLAHLNPLATSIEAARAVLIGDPFPPAAVFLGFVILALAVCRGGFAVFMRYKGILVDVI